MLTVWSHVKRRKRCPDPSFTRYQTRLDKDTQPAPGYTGRSAVLDPGLRLKEQPTAQYGYMVLDRRIYTRQRPLLQASVPGLAATAKHNQPYYYGDALIHEHRSHVCGGNAPLAGCLSACSFVSLLLFYPSRRDCSFMHRTVVPTLQV